MNDVANGTVCETCNGSGVIDHGAVDPTTCPACTGVGLVWWDLDEHGECTASGDELMKRTLIEEVAANAARSLRNALGDWAYPSTRSDLLTYWRSGLAHLLAEPVPTDYIAFLNLCDDLCGQRERRAA